jgi:hypothetical protein
MAPRTIWRRKARASAIFLCCTSRRLAGSFTEEVTWDVENRKPPPFLRVRLEIRLDEDLDGLLAGVYFEADRCIAEIHFMSATALSTNYGMRHLLFRSGWKFLAIGPTTSSISTSAHPAISRHSVERKARALGVRIWQDVVFLGRLKMAAKYEKGDDGLIVEIVGPWAKDKHKILTDYVQASGAARRKYVGTDVPSSKSSLHSSYQKTALKGLIPRDFFVLMSAFLWSRSPLKSDSLTLPP